MRALIAGILQWAAAALGSICNVRPLLDLAEVHFLTMDPLHYKDVHWEKVFKQKKPETDKFDAAARKIFWLGAQALAPGAWLDSQGTASSNAFHLIYLLRHILDASHRRLFDRWLEEAMQRTKQRGSVKFKAMTGHTLRDRSWGHPLPFDILEQDVLPKDLLKGRHMLTTDVKAHKNTFYAPCSSYLEKLSLKERSALKARGITTLRHLAAHPAEELKALFSIHAIYLLRLELAAQRMTFASPRRS